LNEVPFKKSQRARCRRQTLGGVEGEYDDE
jgi:hypothetical protein